MEGNKRKRILIAEDCSDLIDILSILLEKIDFDVTWVSDGEKCVKEALYDFYSGSSFDLIILDIRMPLMNGFEVAKELRNKGIRSKILAMTAAPTEDGIEQSFTAGIDAYVSKNHLSIPLLEKILLQGEEKM